MAKKTAAHAAPRGDTGAVVGMLDDDIPGMTGLSGDGGNAIG